MKTYTYFHFFVAVFSLISISLTAQDNELKKTYLQEGDQVRYIDFYSNGQIAQTGFFLNGKNHGLWTSYNLDGTKKQKEILRMEKR